MGCHTTRSEKLPSGRYGRVDDRVDKNAIFEEASAHLIDFETVLDDDGDDRGFTFSGIKAKGFVTLEHLMGVSPELFP